MDHGLGRLLSPFPSTLCVGVTDMGPNQTRLTAANKPTASFCKRQTFRSLILQITGYRLWLGVDHELSRDSSSLEIGRLLRKTFRK